VGAAARALGDRLATTALDQPSAGWWPTCGVGGGKGWGLGVWG
jgi:hypothetical protein